MFRDTSAPLNPECAEMGSAFVRGSRVAGAPDCAFFQRVVNGRSDMDPCLNYAGRDRALHSALCHRGLRDLADNVPETPPTTTCPRRWDH